MSWPNDPEAQRIVDIVRAILGLEPLYMNQRLVPLATNSRNYTRLESLMRRARADCDKCDGRGYTSIDTYSGEVRCRCLDQTSAVDPSTPSES
jgi:hypothetical protein